MGDKTKAAAETADELTAGAVNWKVREGLEAEIDGEAVKAARADASKFERDASNSDGPEVEIGKATDLVGILAEMRFDFSGSDNDSRWVREYCDRIEAAVGKGEYGEPKKNTNANELAEAVKATRADAEANGITWDKTNTESADKVFKVEIKFDMHDRLKLGILAARCQQTPERFLESHLRTRFEEVADKVFNTTGKGRSDLDKASARLYDALATAVFSGVVGNGRLAFRPSIMA